MAMAFRNPLAMMAALMFGAPMAALPPPPSLEPIIRWPTHDRGRPLKSRGGINPVKKRRRKAFKKSYMANPCNFLPGSVLHRMYGPARSQSALEATAGEWIKAENSRRKAAGIALIPWSPRA